MRVRCGPSCDFRMSPIRSWPGCTSRCSPGKPTATTARLFAVRPTSSSPCRPPPSTKAPGCTCSAPRHDIDRAAAILAESDRIRYLTPRLHSEMIAEVRFPGDQSQDSGIDVQQPGT